MINIAFKTLQIAKKLLCDWDYWFGVYLNEAQWHLGKEGVKAGLVEIDFDERVYRHFDSVNLPLRFDFINHTGYH